MIDTETTETEPAPRPKQTRAGWTPERRAKMESARRNNPFEIVGQYAGDMASPPNLRALTGEVLNGMASIPLSGSEAPFAMVVEPERLDDCAKAIRTEFKGVQAAIGRFSKRAIHVGQLLIACRKAVEESGHEWLRWCEANVGKDNGEPYARQTIAGFIRIAITDNPLLMLGGIRAKDAERQQSGRAGGDEDDASNPNGGDQLDGLGDAPFKPVGGKEVIDLRSHVRVALTLWRVADVVDAFTAVGKDLDEERFVELCKKIDALVRSYESECDDVVESEEETV